MNVIIVNIILDFIVTEELRHTLRTDWTLKPRRRRRFLTDWTSYKVINSIGKCYEIEFNCHDLIDNRLTSRDKRWGLRVKIMVNIWLFGSVSQNVSTRWLPTAFITWTVPVNWLYGKSSMVPNYYGGREWEYCLIS